MSRIKLKNFKGAEDDTTHAISLDCMNYKAYYRRGLARHALGNLQGAKVDFEVYLLQQSFLYVFFICIS